MGACASDSPEVEPPEAGKAMSILESPFSGKWGRGTSGDSATTAGESGYLSSCDLDSEYEYGPCPSLEDVYDVDANPLGEGSYGSVHKGKCIHTGTVRAIKKIQKGKIKDLTELTQEIEMMRMMSHPNIITLVETYEDSENASLVMELCEGGELFERVIQSGHLSECEAASVMRQILGAVSYMHKNNVMHRDLKLENFLLLSDKPIERNTVKLIDFGFSCRSEPGDVHTEVVGTPHYTAPEVVRKRYDRMCDLWSCGVTLYVLLSGRTPFGGRHLVEIYKRVCEGKYSFRGNVWQEVSDGAKDLIKALLEMDPEKRYTSQEALSHEWIATTPQLASNDEHEDEVVEHLQDSVLQDRLKKAVQHIVAWDLDEVQTGKLREIFHKSGRSGHGGLRHPDLRDFLCEVRPEAPDEDLGMLLRVLDAEGDGAADSAEAEAPGFEEEANLPEDKLWDAFNTFDLDGDGRITQRDLVSLLGTPTTDSNGASCEGSIDLDFEEFVTVMNGDQSSSSSS